MGRGGEDRLARLRFHLADDFTQLTVVGDGFFHEFELLRGERDGDRFPLHLARPLVARSAPLAIGSILDRTLANKSDPGEFRGEGAITAAGRGDSRMFLFHAEKCSARVNRSSIHTGSR
jgi:hypothetical protein